MSDASQGDETFLFDMQCRVLGDSAVSDQAKLMFCRLMCHEGFRSGWILSDRRWSTDDHRHLQELERAGYVTLSQNHGLGARIAPLPAEDE